ncbi:hypothetical protein C0989_010258, partial [Termitomyces sp. Mn162]
MVGPPDLAGKPAGTLGIAGQPNPSSKPGISQLDLSGDLALEIVNNLTIQQLQQRGWSNLLTPINGPADGSPHYAVPRSVLKILNQEEDTHETETEETPSHQLA